MPELKKFTQEDIDIANEIIARRAAGMKPTRKPGTWTTAVFAAYVDIVTHHEYGVTGEFVNMKSSIMMYHKTCGNEYRSTGEMVFYKHVGCPQCAITVRMKRINNINKRKKEGTLKNAFPSTTDTEAGKKLVADIDAKVEAEKEAKITLENYINSLTVEQRKVTEPLITSLNSKYFVSGVYNKRINALVLYNLRQSDKVIERLALNGELESKVFEYKQKNNTIMRYNKKDDQYEFYNVRMLLTLLSDNFTNTKPIFNDVAKQVTFYSGYIPENILQLNTSESYALNYNFIYTLLSYGLKTKLISPKDANNLIAQYLEEGYTMILSIIPYTDKDEM